MEKAITSLIQYGICTLFVAAVVGIAYLIWITFIEKRQDLLRDFPGHRCPPPPPPPPKREGPEPVSYGFHNIYKNQYGEEILGRIAHASHDYAKANIDHSEQDSYTETVKVIRFKSVTQKKYYTDQNFSVDPNKVLSDYRKEVTEDYFKTEIEQATVCTGKPSCRYVEACGMASCSQCGLIDYYGH